MLALMFVSDFFQYVLNVMVHFSLIDGSRMSQKVPENRWLPKKAGAVHGLNERKATM